MIDLGISPKEFRENFFESKPFLKSNSYSKDFITWNDVNEALYISESSPLGIKVHKDGFVPEDQFIETCFELGIIKKKIIKKALYDFLNEGASIIFNRMESLSLPIRNICNEVSRFIGENVVANGYIAFGGKESFGVHWDTHDVFAIQLIGKKRWKVFQPTFLLPLANQTSKLHKNECPEEPLIDVVLEAGDILYIPRGWWHTAVPLNEETFHIAVGSHQLTVIDFVKWVTDKVLPDISECRRSLEFSSAENNVILDAIDKIHESLSDKSIYANFQSNNLKNERMSTGFDISRCMKPAGIASFQNTAVSFCSKNLPIEILTPLPINGLEIPIDGDSVAILEIVNKSTSPTSFEKINQMLPCIEANAIAEKLAYLATNDVIQIHAQSSN